MTLLRKLSGLPASALGLSIIFTSPALMAHGCGESKEEVCRNAKAMSIAYRVSGTCGAAGRMVVTSPDASCNLSFAGGDFGLPAYGTRINAPELNIANGGWTLWGARGDQSVNCTVSRAAGSALEAVCSTSDGKEVCRAALQPE
jgi:hypothetical protein